MENIFVIDLTSYLNGEDKSLDLCNKVLESLHKTGILIIKDPRINEKYNDDFINMMEKYYNLPYQTKLKHIRKDLHYQIGLTPEFIEKPLDHCEIIHKLANENRAHKPIGKDIKARWFYQMNPPNTDDFKDISGINIIPEEFPEWEETIHNWGDCFLNTLDTLCEMISLSLDLNKNYLTEMCHNGSHLIAPTFSDLSKYGTAKTILAGFHQDISFLTIHGKSRYPGLNIWTRDMSRIRVKVPDGYLLVQAGLQIEYLTAGYITAGYHEVVVEEDTIRQIDMNRNVNGINPNLVRVSSTCFSHINSDKYLDVITKFRNEENIKNYPKIKEGDWLRYRLEKIKLGP